MVAVAVWMLVLGGGAATALVCMWRARRALIQARVELARAVADRETLEREARATDEFLRNVIDTVPGFVCVKGLGGRFDLANRMLADAYGTTTADIVGKTDAELNHDAAQVAAFVEDDRAVILGGRTKHIPAERFTRACGEERWIETTKVPLVEKDGSCTRLLAVALDITERRRLEQELFQAQKMNAIGKLAGGIAHDFNNLLTGILGASEVLLHRCTPDADAANLCRLIQDASTQAAKLTQQLLAFSRKAPLAPVPLDVHALLERVAQLLEHTLDKKISLLRDFAPGAPHVLADPAYIQSALLNLALNARDAMPSGGRLRFATATVCFDEEECRDASWELRPGTYVEVSVSDTGVGMDDAELQRIFEPFFTTKPSGQGTGLGLAAVYGTVRSHKGKVVVQSQKGSGTVFNIYLPAVEGAVAAAEEVGEHTLHGSGRILVVDDERVVRVVARQMLSGLGYEVLDVASAAEALDLLASPSAFNLVLLDMIMPDMDGLTALDRIRSAHPALPIVMFSGFSHGGAAPRALEAGANAFIHKPFRLAELAQTVSTAMHRRTRSAAV